MQTKQQQRAKFALEKVAAMGKIDKETANFIAGTPAMILTNGLGQTLAFLRSEKSKDGQKETKKAIVFKVIKEWLCDEFDYFGKASAEDIDFLNQFNKVSQQNYRKAQHEALSLLEWLKRYARAFQVEDNKAGGNDN